MLVDETGTFSDEPFLIPEEAGLWQPDRAVLTISVMSRSVAYQQVDEHITVSR